MGANFGEFISKTMLFSIEQSILVEEMKFGKFMVIHQICQCFPLQSFPLYGIMKRY